MTFTELQSISMADRWRGLTHQQQEEIGVKVLGWLFAEIVAFDDGTETTKAERDEAHLLMDAAFSTIAKPVEAAFPNVQWWNQPSSQTSAQSGDHHAQAA